MNPHRAVAFSTASPEDVWAHYADVSRWPTWDEGLESAHLDGPFLTGTTGRLVASRQPPISFMLTEVSNGHIFTTESRLGPVVVTVRHRLERMFGGCRIAHELEISGPEAQGWVTRLAPSMDHAVGRLSRLTSPTAPRLGGVILSTRDVSKKASFYQRAFGCEVGSQAPGNTYLQLAGPVPVAFASETFIEKSLPTPVRPARADEAPAASELMLVFADVAAAYRRALDAGATAVLEPVTKPWGQVVASVRDDDGVLVELCSPWS